MQQCDNPGVRSFLSDLDITHSAPVCLWLGCSEQEDFHGWRENPEAIVEKRPAPQLWRCRTVPQAFALSRVRAEDREMLGPPGTGGTQCLLVQKTKTALEFKIHSNWILETQSLKQLCPTKGLYSYPQKSFWRGKKKGSSNFKLGPQNLLVCGSFLGLSAYYQKVKCLRLLKKDLHKLLSPASYMRLMKLEQIGMNSHPGQPCTPKNRPSQTHGAQVWVPTPTLESFPPARDVGGKPSVRVQKMLLSVDMGPVVPGLVNPDNDTETREQMGRTQETLKVSNEPTGLWREIAFAIQTSACLSPLWSLCIKKEESQTTNDLAIG